MGECRCAGTVLSVQFSATAVRGLVAFGIVALLGSCSGEQGLPETPKSGSLTADSSTAAPAVSAASAGTATTADATCPAWGRWLPCSVEYRLTRAGLVVQRRDAPVRHDFLRVPGIVYRATNVEIQVFLYPSPDERSRDTERLDAVGVAPRGERVAWKVPATLVVSNNLAAIILTLNARTAERIALALEAGMPLDPPPRR